MRKILLTFGLFLLCACNETLQLSEAQNGQKFVVTVGQPVEISLQENPTTGYGWKFWSNPENGFFTAVSENFIAPKNGLTGAGGVKTFKATVAMTGSTTLFACYHRWWEKTPCPAENLLKFEFAADE